MEHKRHLLLGDVVGTVAQAAPLKRKRGRALSRRSGQNGSIERSGNWMVVRFWLDVPGLGKRKHMAERICRVSDHWTRSEQIRKAREIVEASGADTTARFNAANDGTTFSEQTISWLANMADPHRRGGKVAPSTLETVEGALRKWLKPHVGDLLLSECDNAAAKKLIQAMRKGGLADKTINNYFQVFSSVIARAIP